jgi:secreted PhoX family phosphatase
VTGTGAASGAQTKGSQLDRFLKRDPFNILDLPEGFSYHAFSETGEKLDDGFYVPGKHDGMGAFEGPDGRTILVRNHEVPPGEAEIGPFAGKRSVFVRMSPSKMYDYGNGKAPSHGGTTTLVYDTKHRRLERHYLSLAGTHTNCAGGIMPWGSWISCEEAVELAEAPYSKNHGYNFEVPARSEGLVDPLPLVAMGRFRHEAVACDPGTGIVYQTEDRYDSLMYRFIPAEPGKLAKGGRLQALRLRDKHRFDTRNWAEEPLVRVGDRLAVEWVEIKNPEAQDDDLRYQGYYESGCARFARAEGIYFGKGAVYIACTNGGLKKKGQIWRYTPSPSEGTADEAKSPGTLELFVEPNDGSLVENCDNLCVAPWGDLMVCEDGISPQFIVGIRPDGSIYKVARTTLSEFAGACFSPDGTTLFVNIQTPGITLAIVGPWREYAEIAR